MGMAGFTVALMMIGVIISPCVYGREFSDHQEIEVERLLKRLNKHALISIKSDDGDIIDCVPIQSQLAFDHPLLKNHTIQMRPSFIPESTSTYTTDITNVTQYATMNSKGKYFGTEFVVNIWKPYVQGRREFSLAQTWIVSGDGPTKNTIEAGFQADGYQHTGCYNTDCPGFVQMSKRVTVGGTFKTVSQYGGDQFVHRIVIWRDRKNGKKWWLKVGDEFVGYWPSSLFTSIRDGAKRVSWGGEIVNDMTGGKHTATDMGSGHFAEEGNKKASYFRNLKIVSDTNFMREPKGVYTKTTNANCYNIKAGPNGTSWGVKFYYGGPGLNAKCP
ncbi:hypothetical protein Bca4012_035211 [Brassica carinata]